MVKTHAIILGALLATPNAMAEEAEAGTKAAKPALRLPPGMARANEPEEVAALHDGPMLVVADEPSPEARLGAAWEQISSRGLRLLRRLTFKAPLEAEPMGHARRSEDLERQRELRRQELEEEELEARRRAWARKCEEDRDRTYAHSRATAPCENQEEREMTQSEIAHAQQRRINEEYWREQRLLQKLEKK